MTLFIARKHYNESLNFPLEHLTNEEYLAPVQQSLGTDCEVLWRKLSVQGSKPLYIGCYYRPTNNEILPVTELNRSLDMIPKPGNNTPNIFLTGDFNLPDIEWDNLTVKSNHNYTAMLNEEFIKLMNDQDLSKVNQHPTRQDNILDLTCTTNPDLVKNVQTHPGMSDHKIVIIDIDIKAKIPKRKARNVYMYKRGDMEAVKNDMSKLYVEIDQMKSDKPAEEILKLFTAELEESMRKHIPQKRLSTRWNVPWITGNIRRKIKKKQKAYNKAKKSKKEADWKEFRDIRRSIKCEMKSAHNEYVMSLLNLEDSDEGSPRIYSAGKKFWSYIRSRKRDNVGIPSLTEEGREFTEAKAKARVLSRQYDSVFTNEDMEQTPTLSAHQMPLIDDLHVNVVGIEKLLSGLNVKKANGPDGIPTRVLKEASKEIAPILTLIYNISLSRDEVPSQWKKAHIVAKGRATSRMQQTIGQYH